MPMMPNACDSLSGLGTFGKSDFPAISMMPTMPRIVAPREICTTSWGRARPIMAPTMADAEAMSAGKRDHEARAADEVEVERKEPAHDGNVEHAAAHAAQDREDAQDEGDDEEHQGPDPPGRG